MSGSNKSIHFIGIGGISMSSLAATALERGYKVSGSDRTKSPLTEELAAKGAEIFYSHAASNLGEDPSALTVVYTAAISPDNPELAAAREGGARMLTRAQFLGEVMLGYKTRIGIAGTHGKSTTTAMTALIFEAAKKDPTAIDGAVIKEYNAAYKNGSGEDFIFEACEYTDSFLSFFPTTAVITNVDFDHADYFHSVSQYVDSFARYMALADKAVIDLDSANSSAALRGYKGELITVSAERPDADYTAANITSERGCAAFDLICRGEKKERITLGIPGIHNVGNALCAIAAALENGCTIQACSEALAAFHGIKRRFELVADIGGVCVYDDYAHHPEEIRATLSAARSTLADGGRVICIYQPHSVSRTVELFDGFVSAFNDADSVIFADIYENLEHDTGAAGLTSADLAAKAVGTSAEYLPDFASIAARAVGLARPGDSIVTMGAGSIYKVSAMLEKLLAEKFGSR